MFTVTMTPKGDKVPDDVAIPLGEYGERLILSSQER